MNQNLIINATDSHLEAIRKLNENRAPLIDNLVPLEHLPAFRVDDEHALQPDVPPVEYCIDPHPLHVPFDNPYPALHGIRSRCWKRSGI